MYAGTVVEIAKVKEFFDNPLHPYSKGLLLATPRLSGGIGEGIFGHIPNYVNLPKGCAFYKRCPKRMEICKREDPSFVEVTKGHTVRCHLFKK